MGRLNFNGSWSAALNDRNQYLGIDLGEDFTVTGIATQGSSDKATWVTKYFLQYRTASDDHPNNYTEIMPGQEQMKVNSLNGFLSIIYVKKQKWYFIILLTIFIRNVTRRSIHLRSMTWLMHTCYAYVWSNFLVLSLKCWAQNWTNWAKKGHCSTALGAKKGRTGAKWPRLSLLAIWLWLSTVY